MILSTKFACVGAIRKIMALSFVFLPSIGYALPTMVDNSKTKYFPEIFDQGSNNACSQASGVRYVFSYEVNRLLDRDASDPVNVFCYHFTWNFLNEGDNQGSHAYSGYDLMKDCGALNLTQMEDKPYSFAQQTEWPSGAQTYIDAMSYRVAGYSKINIKTRKGIDSLRQYLSDHGDGSSTGGVVSVSCKTDNWGYKRYDGPTSTDIKHIITAEGKDGPHAITITGYDDTVEYDLNNDGTISEDERGAFIFVNSWGNYWGTEGRCLMPYSLVLASPDKGGLSESDADAYMVEPFLAPPKIVFKVRLKYNRRNELSFILGAKDMDSSKTERLEMTSPIMNYQGGSFPLGGYYGSEEIEVAFCFDRYYDNLQSFTNPQFYLSLRRVAASGSGVLSSFSVVDLEKGMAYTSSDTNLLLLGGLTTAYTGQRSVPIDPSCSKWRWLVEGTKRPVSSPFAVRTANGKKRKLKINGYDPQSGMPTITHSKL